MAEQEATADYIDISEIPLVRRGHAWPWEEWKKIPVGKGLEVTDLLDGIQPKNFYQTIRQAEKAHPTGLVCWTRNGRVWICRPKPAS